MSDVKTKVCKVCGEEKPVNEFNHTSIKKNDGTYIYNSKCKVCLYKENRNIIYDDILTENILDIILDSILNQKIDSLNELQDILNLSLEKIIEIVKMLNIKKKIIRVKFKCTVCGEESERTLSQFERSKFLFCSKECKDIHENSSYGISQGYAKCNKCGEIKHIEEFTVQKRKNGTYSYLTCKVCDYFRRHKNIIIIEDNWSKDEYIIILDNILNNKVKFIDDIVYYLNNKTLYDVAILLKNNLKIAGSASINFKETCTYCNKDMSIKSHQFFDDELHFCSSKCNAKYYGEIKTEQTPKYNRICQLDSCKKEFYVDTNRVNNGNDKFCSSKCSQISQMIKFKGENNPNWQGGITQLYEFLRRSLLQWKNDSIINCNYKCVLSGDRFNDIHHLYSFESIIKDTLLETNLELKSNISHYSQDELLLLSDKCLEIHYRHPLGVCLKQNIHILFHNLYGYKNNNEKQFEEFKQRYNNGEFHKLIS